MCVSPPQDLFIAVNAADLEDDGVAMANSTADALLKVWPWAALQVAYSNSGG